jgi:tetratricopeptide (TPR) repeat protein
MDLLESRILLVERQWQPAAELLGRVPDAPAATAEDRRAAWELLAQCHTALGDDAAAADALALAEALHQELTAASLANAEQYLRNRFDLDGRRTYAADRLADSARAATAAGRPERAAQALLDHYLAFPDDPHYRENAVAAGEALLALAEAGFREAGTPGTAAELRENRDVAEALLPVAMACFLRALDSGLDRVFAKSAMLAENQVQLDTVCQPMPEALLRRALAGLNRSEQLAGSERGLGDAQRADFAAAYGKALALTYEPDGGAAAGALASLAETSRAPWSWLCLLELARVHLRGGDPAAAAAALDGIDPRRRLLGLAQSAPVDRLFAAEREFLQGVAAADVLAPARAARHFADAAMAGGPLLAPRARFEQARALELVGAWRKAEEGMAGLCPTAPPGRLVSPDPSGMQSAADLAEVRGGTADPAMSPRPAVAVLAQDAVPPDRPLVSFPFRLRRTASASGGSGQAVPDGPSGSTGRPTGAAAMRLPAVRRTSAASAAAPTARGVRGDRFPRPPAASAPLPPSLARAAAIALARLAEFAKTGDGLPRHSPVQLLPDDRTTRGDWFLGYGVERHVLCAQNYRFDREGGPASGFAVRFSTTDPKEPGRLWVSAKRTDDPAALWDPARRLRLPANRDDRGEQYPLGQGPDLLLDCAMPAGEHVLSLYFVNDHHYYEPNRRYTIEIRENGGLLLLADVRDFGGGVYKRFRVEGPRELQVRMRRDASLNVILQGVFLDPVYRPRPLPGLAAGAGLPTAAALWQRCEALRTAGRWREAEAAFAEFANALPGDAIEAVQRELAADESLRPDAGPARRRLYPLGRHPLDRLWAVRLAAVQAPSADWLSSLVGSRRPDVTPWARLEALARLEAAHPDVASAPGFAAAAAACLEEGGREAESLATLRQALASPPCLWSECILRCGLARLLVGSEGGDNPTDELLANFERLSGIARRPEHRALLAATAAHTAEAFRRRGNEVPASVTAVLETARLQPKR